MQTPGTNPESQKNPTSGVLTGSRGPLVLVGATVRSAAESAKMAGFTPIAVDQYGDRETLQAADSWISLDDLTNNDSHEFLDRIVKDDIPIAIVGGIRGGYDWISRSGGRFLGASPRVFSLCDSPDSLAKMANEAGVGFPLTRDSSVAEPGWLIKNVDSSGGLGVRYFDVNAREVGTQKSYAQRVVPGPVLGVSYLAAGGNHLLLGACRLLKKRIGKSPFVFAGALGPITLSKAIESQLQRLGETIVGAVGLNGPFNVDVVIHDGSVTLLEINPRWSASMEIVERSWHDVSQVPCSLFGEFDSWSKLVVSHPMAINCAPYLKRVVFAKTDRVIDPAQAWSARQESDGQVEWKDIPNSETTVRRHEPIATTITRLDRISLRQAFRIMV